MRTRPLVLAAALTAAALAVAGCSSDSGDAGGSGGSTAGSGSTASPQDVIAVTVTHGAISPKPSVHKVHLGDRVELKVTSDQDDEAHLHGYDKEIELKAGTPGTVDITANIPGIFEVELHRSNLQLLQLEVAK